MPVAVLVHHVANKVDRAADFCPQMANEQPQRAGKSGSQAQFTILNRSARHSYTDTDALARVLVCSGSLVYESSAP